MVPRYHDPDNCLTGALDVFLCLLRVEGAPQGLRNTTEAQRRHPTHTHTHFVPPSQGGTGAYGLNQWQKGEVEVKEEEKEEQGGGRREGRRRRRRQEDEEGGRNDKEEE